MKARGARGWTRLALVAFCGAVTGLTAFVSPGTATAAVGAATHGPVAHHAAAAQAAAHAAAVMSCPPGNPPPRPGFRCLSPYPTWNECTAAVYPQGGYCHDGGPGKWVWGFVPARTTG